MSIRLTGSDMTDRDFERCNRDLMVISKISRAAAIKGSKPTKLMCQSVVDSHLYLPYYYATKVLGKPHNKAPEHDITFTGELRPHQEPLVDESMDHLNNTHTVLVESYPGSGKTVMGCYLSGKLKRKVLVVHTMTNLNASWEETFQKFTNNTVWVVDARKKPPPEEPDVIISMDGRLGKIPEAWLAARGTLLIDEVHMFYTANRYAKLLGLSSIEYVIALSATAEKDNQLHKALFKMVDPNCRVSLRLKQPITVNYVEFPSKYVLGDNPWDSYCTAQANDEARNTAIIDYAKRIHRGKTMILTCRLDHLHNLGDLLKDEGIAHNRFYAGSINEEDHEFIIGNYQVSGTGFDLKMYFGDNYKGAPIQDVIIAFSIKESGLIYQVAGRSFRCSDPKVHHFGDKMYAEKHWVNASKVYNELHVDNVVQKISPDGSIVKPKTRNIARAGPSTKPVKADQDILDELNSF